MVDKTKVPRLSGQGSPRVWNFREATGNTPNFQKLLELKADLPSRSYIFESTHLESPPVPNSSGVQISEFDVSGFHYLYAVCAGASAGPAGNPIRGDMMASWIRGIDNNLRAAIRQEVANVPTIIAEARKSIGTVSGIIRDVFGMMKDLARGQPQRALNLLVRGNTRRQRNALPAGLANRWLEFSFAVKPLYHDAKAIAKDVVKRLNDGNERLITASVRDSQEFNGQAYLAPPAGFSQPWYKAVCQAFWHASAEYVYRIDNPVTAAASAYQFDDPASLAWELVPFSFVVDWFLPVGEYLSSIRDVKGISGVRSFRSLKGKGSIVKSSRTGSKTRFSNSRCESKVRDPYSGIPAASWQGFRPSFGATQATHVLALMTQWISSLVK